MQTYLTDLDSLRTTLKMRFVVNQKAILLLYHEGKAFAIPDRFPHLGISLYEGTYDATKGFVICRGHGAKINVENGQIESKAHLAFFNNTIKKSTPSTGSGMN